MFLYDESFNTLLNRMDGIGMDLRNPYESELLAIHQIDSTELSPGGSSLMRSVGPPTMAPK
jgi:circadian clock protein KaiC